MLLAIGGAPLATVAVLYRVGSRNEAVGHTGAAHLLEHMLFKGTERNNPSRGYGIMEAMWEIGANVNANTWLDRTLYFETLPVGHVSFALELEADRMLGALVSRDAKQSEMTVVRNELEQRASNPRVSLEQALSAIAYVEHPYHHPTIGWRTDVENMPIECLQAFYRTFYRPDNATVFVLGGIDIEATAADVVKHFGNLRGPLIPTPDVYTSEPPQLGERSITIRWPGNTKMVACGYHIPGTLGQRHVLSSEQLRERAAKPEALSESCALEVLENVLAAGASSRLRRRLVDSGLAHDVWARNGINRDPGLFVIGAAAQVDVSLDAVSEAIWEEVGSIANNGISEGELLQAKASLAADKIHHDERIENLALVLAEWEARGGWELDSAYREVLQGVTLEGVSRAARAYLYEDNRTVARLEPGAPALFSIPFAETVAGARETVKSGVVRPAIPAVPHAPLPNFATGIVGETLAENVVWNFVRRDVAPTVHLRGLLQTGPTFSGANSELATVTARMLARGTELRDRATIDALLREIGASRAYNVDRPGGDPLAFRFQATSLAESLNRALELLAEELSAPKLSPQDFELVRAELAGAIRLSQTDTAGRARQRLLEMLYPQQHPNCERNVEQRLEDLQSMTLDDVRAYHLQLVSRGRLIVSIVGDCQALEVERLLNDAFVRLPQRKSWQPDVQLGGNVVSSAGRSFVELGRKPNADVYIGRATELTRTSPDYQTAVLANQILCGHPIEGRLGQRLRATEGLTYGAPGQLFGAALTPGFWNAHISTNPANVNAVIASALEVLEGYARDGATQREIVAAKNATVGSTFVSLGANTGIARMIEAIEYYGLGKDYVDELPSEIEAISEGDVHRVGATLFVPRELSIVTAGSKPGG